MLLLPKATRRNHPQPAERNPEGHVDHMVLSVTSACRYTVDTQMTTRLLVWLFRLLHEHCLNSMMKRLAVDQRKQVLATQLQALVRHAHRDGETASMFFSMAQSMGFHLLPVHYYSPVPNTSELPERTWTYRFDRVPGWSLNREKQLQLLAELARWAPEMADTPTLRREGDPSDQYFWNNSMFNASDAVVYHSMIRHFKPKQILEIGCGYSTMVAARAARLNGNTRLRCIEPFPMAELRQGIQGVECLIDKPLQDVSISLFESLERNDI